jgi:hypothetical protein
LVAIESVLELVLLLAELPVLPDVLEAPYVVVLSLELVVLLMLLGAALLVLL